VHPTNQNGRAVPPLSGTFYFHSSYLSITKSSATADGPSDALCQSKSCQLLTAEGTSCSLTANPQQIEVMEFDHYNRPIYNKLVCASNHGASTIVGVVNKLDRRRVLATARSICRGLNSVKQSSTGKYHYFCRCPSFLKHSVGYAAGSLHAKQEAQLSPKDCAMRRVS